MKDTSTKHKKTRRFDSDKLFKLGATVAGVYVLVIIVLIVFQLSFESYPIWAEEGLGFVTGTDWNRISVDPERMTDRMLASNISCI